MMNIPEGWQKVTVEDLCEFSNGHGFRPPDWSASGLPIIRIQNLNGSQNFNYFAGEPERDWLVEPGTILFAWAGTKCVSFGPTIWQGPRGVLNQHIYRIHPKAGVDQFWLFSVLQEITGRIERNAHGFKATLVHVRKADILEQIVACPPLAEQRKIAAILGKWDEAIATAEHLVAALRARKQALMQQLLTGEVRFPGSESQWRKLTVGELIESSTAGEWGDEPDTSEYTYPVIRSTNFTKDGKLNLSVEKTVKRKLPQRKVDRILLKKGDLLLEKSGGSPDQPVGRVVYFGDENQNYGYANFLQKLVVKKNLNPKAVYYFLQHSYQSKKVLKYQQQTTGIINFQLADYLKFCTISFPPSLQEQDQIVAVLDLVDEELTGQERLIELYQQQKRGLMKRLLMGEVRVVCNEDNEK